MDQGTANRPAAHPRGERGFSLVETLFAVLVLVVAGGGLVRTLAQASNRSLFARLSVDQVPMNDCDKLSAIAPVASV